MNTPSEKLAEVILRRLVEENLLRAQSVPKLLPALAEGQIKADDWRLEIELAATEDKLA